jgi:sugar lactone lactonase YvrE
MSTISAEVAGSESYELGEGPVWDAGRQRLLWVDIPQGRVLVARLRGDGVEVTDEHRMPGEVAAAVVPTADGGLLVALHRSLATITPDGRVRTGRRVLPDSADSRLNDGACDPVGRFLVGSMSLDGRERCERLYRLDAAGTVEVVDEGFTLSNGLGWAPNGQTLFHVDSVPGVVWSRAYDPASGAVGERRVHLRIRDGLPDGLCVDREGNLWVAVWGAGEVRCFDAGGKRIATVTVAAPHTSSVAFVGAELDRLLITTARQDLSSSQLASAPLSGRLFLAEVGATGVPSTPWAGSCEDIS